MPKPMEPTPGPWHRDISSGTRCDVRAENGRKVALCWGLSTSKAAAANSDRYREECDANAHLIAAAPDLLAALRWFIDDIDGNHTVMLDFDANVARARAALLRASGRQGGVEP